MKVKYRELIIVLIFLSFMLILNKNFQLFPQAYVLYLKKVKIINLVLQKNFHLLRYLVAYPSIAWSNLFKLDINIVYTVYLYIIGIVIIKLSFKIYCIENKIIKKLIYLYTLIFYLIIYNIVNGRVIFAYLGEILFIYETISDRNRKKIIFLSIFLASVSSGTMLVMIFSVVFHFFTKIKILEIITQYKKIMIFGGTILFILARKMIIKNLYFFDGNILKILNHGIFGNYSNIWQLTLSSIYLSIIFLFFIFFRKNKDSIQKLIIVSLSFGIFGKTTFTMSLIPIFFKVGFFLNKIKIINRGKT